MAGLSLAAAVFVMLASAPQAKADPYRWCAHYGPDGGTNCGFITLDQCRATVSGIGGICQPNPFYTGPDRPLQTRKKKSRPS